MLKGTIIKAGEGKIIALAVNRESFSEKLFVNETERKKKKIKFLKSYPILIVIRINRNENWNSWPDI